MTLSLLRKKYLISLQYEFLCNSVISQDL